MRSTALLGVLLASCAGGGGAKHGTPSWVDPEVARRNNGPCIAPPDDGGAVTHAAVVGLTGVRYCVGHGPQCFELELATGKLAYRQPPDDATRGSGARAEARDPVLEICGAGATRDCKPMTAKIIPNAAELHAATNPAGTMFVVALGDAAAGRGYVEVWDVAKSKKLTTFRYARGDFRCGEVAMLDDTIYVSASQCTSPAARGALYSLKGAKLADVGGKDFGVYGNRHAHVDGAVWAFLEENATRVVLQDVVKGKIVKTIDTRALFGDAAMGNPGESALLELADGKLAIVAGSPANGSVAVVDPATGDVKVTRAALCR